MKKVDIIKPSIPFIIMNPTASVQDIAQNANVSRATFHRTFVGRDELFEAMTDVCIDEVELALLAINPGEVGALEQMIHTLIELGDRVYFIYYFPDGIQTKQQERKSKKILLPLTDLISKQKSQGIIREDLDDSWILNVLSNLVTIAWTQIYIGRYSHKKAHSQLLKLFYCGISADISKKPAE